MPRHHMPEFDGFESLHIFPFSAWVSACSCRFMHPLKETRPWHSKSQADNESDLKSDAADCSGVCWHAGGYTSSCFHCKATWRVSWPWNSWSGASSGEDCGWDRIGHDKKPWLKDMWRKNNGTHENVSKYQFRCATGAEATGTGPFGAAGGSSILVNVSLWEGNNCETPSNF